MTTSRNLCVTILLLAMTSSVSAEPRHIHDDQGRLVLVIEDDGTVIAYSYNEDNKQVRNNNSLGEAVDYSANGDAVVQLTK